MTTTTTPPLVNDPITLPLPFALICAVVGLIGLYVCFAGWRAKEFGILEAVIGAFIAVLLVWGGLDSLIGLLA